MSYTYRRPHAYAAHHAARIEWQLQPSWTIDETTANLTLTTPAWMLGLFPSVDMTVVTLTLTTPRWNVGDTEIDIAGASLELDTYRWTISGETGWDISGQALVLTTPAWTVNPDLVPYLIGYPIAEAIALARSAGLPPSLYYVKSGAAPVGTVTAQNPASGQPVANFTSITLTVEAGIYVWPSTIIPTQADWRLMTNTGVMISPLDATTRTVGYGGDYWAVSLVVSNLTGGSTATLQAFLARLRGRTHLTLLPDDTYLRRGALAQNVYVDGDGQTGRTLACNGGPLTVVENALRAGDLFSLEDRLYMVTEDADLAATGQVTLSISPPLDGSPADGALVNLLTPYGQFRLTDNIVRWSHAPGGFTSFNSLEFAEVRVPLSDVTFVGLIASASPPSLYASTSYNGARKVTTATTTVSATGGNGSYRYSWARLSGTIGVTPNSRYSATTSFSSIVSPGVPASAVMRCTVTDTSTPANSDTTDVAVEIENTWPA